jgi:hypothetical protein
MRSRAASVETPPQGVRRPRRARRRHPARSLVAAPSSEASLSMIYRLRSGIGTAPGRRRHQHLVVVVVRDRAGVGEALRRSSGARRLGPWTARVGRNGFGSPKREGDGQSPVGAFRVHRARSACSNRCRCRYWRYAEGRPQRRVGRRPAQRATTTPTMRTAGQRPLAQRRVAVPADGVRVRRADRLQPRPTPGAGSAIFLHVSTGSGTAGCVSLPSSQVVALLRWLNQFEGPRVIMGPESAVTYR